MYRIYRSIDPDPLAFAATEPNARTVANALSESDPLHVYIVSHCPDNARRPFVIGTSNHGKYEAI